MRRGILICVLASMASMAQAASLQIPAVTLTVADEDLANLQAAHGPTQADIDAFLTQEIQRMIELVFHELRIEEATELRGIFLQDRVIRERIRQLVPRIRERIQDREQGGGGGNR